MDPADQPFIRTLFDRYIAIWIWSVLFATNTGLLYSLLEQSVFNVGRWNQLALILILPASLSYLFAFYSLYFLYKTLSGFIVPFYLLGNELVGIPNLKEFGYLLQRSFLFLILGAAMRGLLALLQIALIATSGGY